MIEEVNDMVMVLVGGPRRHREDAISTTSTSGDAPTLDAVPSGLPRRIGYLLARAGEDGVREFNRALQPYGLRGRHYTVLVVAASSSGRSQREISDLLGLDPSGIVAMVDDLERLGLVRREPNPDDRRTRLVVATGAGRQRLQETEPVARAVDDRLLADLDENERQTLRALLQRITHT